eukprot:9648535-Ditylum_brightwellii.AAC.1
MDSPYPRKHLDQRLCISSQDMEKRRQDTSDGRSRFPAGQWEAGGILGRDKTTQYNQTKVWVWASQ